MVFIDIDYIYIYLHRCDQQGHLIVIAAENDRLFICNGKPSKDISVIAHTGKLISLSLSVNL